MIFCALINATAVEVVNHVNMAVAARTAMWDIIKYG